MQGSYQRGCCTLSLRNYCGKSAKLKFLLENLCHSIVTNRENVLSREIEPFIMENYDTLKRIVNSRCNDAVGKINSTEKFHLLAIRFSKICLQRVSKWLLAETMPNLVEQ